MACSLSAQIVNLVIGASTNIIIEVISVKLGHDCGTTLHCSAVQAVIRWQVSYVTHCAATRAAKSLSAEHEVTLLLLLCLAYHALDSLRNFICRISYLVEIVAHFLLIHQLSAKHACLQLLLLLVGTALARISGLFEEGETVSYALFVH